MSDSTKKLSTISKIDEMLAYRKIINDSVYFPKFEWDVCNPSPVTPTEFPQLNQFLEGGLRPGLYGFGAISSLGKTTFLVQVADSIATSGRDVLIFTLEMTRNELIAKSISRLTTTLLNEEFRKNGDFSLGATAIDILENRRHHIDANAEEYKTQICVDASDMFRKTIAPNRFIIEPSIRSGYWDIESKIKDFIVERRVQMEKDGKPFFPPIIVIDYLQAIAPGDKKDLRQHIDDVVFNLKNLSKEHQLPIFIISSFNRFMYSKQVSYESFKESGGIEYTADCLLGFNPIYVLEGERIRPEERGYNYKLAKAQNPRIVELVILKNRYGETSGASGIFYEYFPAYNLFRELPDPDTDPVGSDDNADDAMETEASACGMETNQNDRKNKRNRTSKGNRVTRDEF